MEIKYIFFSEALTWHFCWVLQKWSSYKDDSHSGSKSEACFFPLVNNHASKVQIWGGNLGEREGFRAEFIGWGMALKKWDEIHIKRFFCVTFCNSSRPRICSNPPASAFQVPRLDVKVARPRLKLIAVEWVTQWHSIHSWHHTDITSSSGTFPPCESCAQGLLTALPQVLSSLRLLLFS